MNTLRSFSHDVRTELWNILGITWYLKQHPDAEEQSDLLDYISKAGAKITKSLEHLVNVSGSISSISRMSAIDKKPSKFSKKVLLIDDSTKVRKRLTLLLKQVGCTIETAKSGFEALNKALNNFELILVDISLRDMDVIDLIKDLRKIQPNTNCKIVALTAFGQEIQYDLMRAGVNDIVSKFSAPERILGLITLQTTPNIGL